jgi:ubiquinone/menaquinone biosynthesis C-methylase UbiE
MEIDDAAALIAPAVPNAGGTWADLGAGRGTFTRALARLLGPDGRVHAVDRDAAAMASLRGATIATHVADFTAPGVERALALLPLDGVLLANALHFVPRDAQPALLERLAAWLVPNGRLVVVEYEGRTPSRWVPYPVSLERLGAVTPEGMTAPVRVGERRSAYGGTMYAAWSARRLTGGRLTSAPAGRGA